MGLDTDGYQKDKGESGENFKERKLGDKGGIMTTDTKSGLHSVEAAWREIIKQQI